MRRTIVFLLAAAILFGGSAFAHRLDQRAPLNPLPLMGGANDPQATAFGAGQQHFNRSLDEPIGEIFLAGETWYDYQHNGSAGKMIVVDGNGWVHVVWMKGEDPQQSSRHVFYNAWDPVSREFVHQGGVRVDANTRAGYVSLAGLASGWVFPAYHEINSQDPGRPHTAAAIDYDVAFGAFTFTQPAFLREGGQALQLIWPKIAVTRDSTIIVVSTESTTPAGMWQRQYWSRAHPVWDSSGYGLTINWDNVAGTAQFALFDTTMNIAATVAASPVSDRVVIVWTRCRYNYLDDTSRFGRNQVNNDCWYMISEDGGYNWQAPVNVTNFIPADLDCPSGDSTACNNDTFRLYTDTAVLIDFNDNIHIGFTTIVYFEYGGRGYGQGPFTWRQQSGVWHWYSATNEFSPIFNDYNFYYNADTTAWVDGGAWQRNVQRPSFALDPVTGYLYCVLWRYEPGQYSDQLYRMGDVYVAVSDNCGRSWSRAVNVTNTNGGQNTPPPGSLSERDPTVADWVTYEDGIGYLHLFWELDRDAGACIQSPAEGTAQLNPMYYQRIPVTEIPTRPLLNPFWPPLHVDSTGFPGRVIPLDTTRPAPCGGSVPDTEPALRPAAFHLYQNYPNPFNPKTTIQFDLVRDARVTLRVYNVLGQSVATLFDNQIARAGAHTVDFDGSHLSSGVYICRLEVDGKAISRKMVLMK